MVSVDEQRGVDAVLRRKAQHVPRMILCLSLAVLLGGLLGGIAVSRSLADLDTQLTDEMRNRFQTGITTATVKNVLHRVSTRVLGILHGEAVGQAGDDGEDLAACLAEAAAHLEERAPGSRSKQVLQALAFRCNLGRGLLAECRSWRDRFVAVDGCRRLAAITTMARAAQLGRVLTDRGRRGRELLATVRRSLGNPEPVLALAGIAPMVARMLAVEETPGGFQPRIGDDLDQVLRRARAAVAAGTQPTLAVTIDAGSPLLGDVGGLILGAGGGGDQDGLIALQTTWLGLHARGRSLERSVSSWHLELLDDLEVYENSANNATRAAQVDFRDTLRSTLWLMLLMLSAAVGLFAMLAWVVSRSALHHIQDLERARRDAATAADAKGRFLANMSHEIRTPMNGVMGMADLLIETDLNAEQRHYARTIQHSAHALLTVLNDILDYSKIEAGKLELEEVDFDPRVVVGESVELLSPLASQKGIELITYCGHDVPTSLVGDANRLRQVLLNLVGNAIKFTAEGEVQVTVERIGESDGRCRIRLAVVDTGIGMTPEVQARLFQPFSQADASTTRKYGGTGLGLAICRRLVGLMGGELRVDSAAREGSRFWFELELGVGGGPRAAGVPDLRQFRALVVDASESSRQVLALHLAATMIGFDIAESPQQGIELLRRAAAAGKPFDVVLIDSALPSADADALLQCVRATSDTRVVVLCTVGEQPDAARIAAGDGWLGKPVREADLGRVLIGVLTRDDAAGRQPMVVDDGRPLDLSVLVAEDNRINRRVIGTMLEKLGCRPSFAGDGREAVERFGAGGFDVVLMDCQMPEMDGYEATRVLRSAAGAAGRTVPIIALTANAMPADRDACLEAGMDDFLSKPVHKSTLRAMLWRWAYGGPGRAPESLAAAADGG